MTAVAKLKRFRPNMCSSSLSHKGVINANSFTKRMTPGGVCEISIYDRQHGRKHALACGCELVDRVGTSWIVLDVNSGGIPDTSAWSLLPISISHSLFESY